MQRSLLFDEHDPEVTALLAELWGVAVPPATSASALQQRWKHSGSLWINTTENGVPIKPQSEIDTPILEYP